MNVCYRENYTSVCP